MPDIDKIIDEVNWSMSAEGFPLTDKDKTRIRHCLTNPSSVEKTMEDLLKKHTLPKTQENEKTPDGTCSVRSFFVSGSNFHYLRRKL